MNELTGYYITLIILIGVGIIVMRYLGPWIFKINEIIDLQKQILDELKKKKQDGESL